MNLYRSRKWLNCPRASPTTLTGYKEHSACPPLPVSEKAPAYWQTLRSVLSTHSFFMLTKTTVSSAASFSLAPALLHSGKVSKGLFPKCLLPTARKSTFFQPQACVTTITIFLHLVQASVSDWF